MSKERAAALADEVEEHDRLIWDYAGDLMPVTEQHRELIVAALRAYAPVTGDVREALATVISETAVYGYEPGEGYQMRNPHECADAALAAITAAGWGPRETHKVVSLGTVKIESPEWPDGPFEFGDHVEKISGAEWSGYVCGFYVTEQTPIGYAVKSDKHANTVQIYPAKALRQVESTDFIEKGGDV